MIPVGLAVLPHACSRVQERRLPGLVRLDWSHEHCGGEGRHLRRSTSVVCVAGVKKSVFGSDVEVDKVDYLRSFLSASIVLTQILELFSLPTNSRSAPGQRVCSLFFTSLRFWRISRFLPTDPQTKRDRLTDRLP